MASCSDIPLEGLKNTGCKPRIDDVMWSVLEQIQKAEFEAINAHIRKYATPPIKGELTAGKMKWRGLKMFIQIHHFPVHKKEVSLSQRGVKIGPTLVFKPQLKLASNFELPEGKYFKDFEVVKKDSPDYGEDIE